MKVAEYRGEQVRRSVADLREAKYRSEGKDCYVSLLLKIVSNICLYSTPPHFVLLNIMKPIL